MRLNLKSIFKSQLMVIKAVEVTSAELNICLINTKYSTILLSVPVGEWLAYFPFDSNVPGSSRTGRYFIFQKISWLKSHWNVPAIQSTEWSLNGGWNATEIHLSRHHSVVIQPPFSYHSVDWMAGTFQWPFSQLIFWKIKLRLTQIEPGM